MQGLSTKRQMIETERMKEKSRRPNKCTHQYKGSIHRNSFKSLVCVCLFFSDCIVISIQSIKRFRMNMCGRVKTASRHTQTHFMHMYMREPIIKVSNN